MGVRFCLICVKIVTPLPFLGHPLLPLRAWAVTSSIGRGWTPEPSAKLQWCFWCQCWGEHWVLTYLCAASRGMDKGCHCCGLGKPSLLKVAQQPFKPCAWCTGRWELCYSNTWKSGVHCPHQIDKTPCECSSWGSRTNRQLWRDWHFPGAVELYSSPPRAHTMEALCCYCTCQHHKARWKWPQWRRHSEKKLRVCTSEQAEPHISCTQRNEQMFRNLCSTIMKETFFCHKIRVF